MGKDWEGEKAGRQERHNFRRPHPFSQIRREWGMSMLVRRWVKGREGGGDNLIIFFEKKRTLFEKIIFLSIKQIVSFADAISFPTKN